MSAYQPIIERLLTLHPKRIDLSLDRMWRILGALDHPERKLPPVIHVAGTNGKGSTLAFMRAVLEAAGKSVHVYTSPHLVRFNERFRLGAPGGGKLRSPRRRFAGMRTRQWLRADHGVRDRNRRGVSAVLASSRRRRVA
jgi:dihydrofolate synthase/folylpolyglutamate synthase